MTTINVLNTNMRKKQLNWLRFLDTHSLVKCISVHIIIIQEYLNLHRALGFFGSIYSQPDCCSFLLGHSLVSLVTLGRTHHQTFFLSCSNLGSQEICIIWGLTTKSTWIFTTLSRGNFSNMYLNVSLFSSMTYQVFHKAKFVVLAKKEWLFYPVLPEVGTLHSRHFQWCSLNVVYITAVLCIPQFQTHQ